MTVVLTENASAKGLFDTSAPSNIFTFGARIGINTANFSPGSSFPAESTTTNNNWGTGFNVGIVVNLNLRGFFVIQPGFFFESRSNDFTSVYASSDNMSVSNGHTRNYTFQIPILASLRITPVKFLKWSIDFGPYISFGLGGKTKSDIQTMQPGNIYEGYNYNNGYYDNHKRMDFGLKMGTGITILSHYYFGIHYEAGMLDAFKNSLGGKNKAWTFTLGYDF